MEKSLNEDTYEKLKYHIMNFKLVPGDSISAQKIAVRYNVVCCDKKQYLYRHLIDTDIVLSVQHCITGQL